jgi:hypothetical protein
LDAQLCKLLEAGSIPADRVANVAEFVLARGAARATETCLTKLDRAGSASTDEIAARVAFALLSQAAAESWDPVFAFLRRRQDLARGILADLAHRHHHDYRRHGTDFWLANLTIPRAGQLLELLIDLFPYETDRKSNSGLMHQVVPDDSAREFRGTLMTWLAGKSTGEAVLVFQHLERKFATRYPWIRHPRAAVERAFRLSTWGPIPPTSVAALLHLTSKRLIRSASDAVDGITYAIEEYGRQLQAARSDDLEDFWNNPTKEPPTPKSEDRISAKICDCIREYFEKYAVTADREVQVYRRKTSRNDDGAPGSEVDVLTRIPASGSLSSDAIAIPIEVKRSSNPEGRTALRSQLVNRYMREIGTNFGVFVIAWMQAHQLVAKYKPIWKDIHSAKTELERQANELQISSSHTVGVLVLDVSLPRRVSRKRKKPAVAKRARRAAKKKPVQRRNGKRVRAQR